MLHRDVKPANILLGPDGRVMLTDFGIATAAGSPTLTNSGVLLGSPSYLAPERARGGRASPAADLWALGASLFTAVEGRPPFERDGALASLAAVVADELDPPAHAGPLGPLIEGLLRKDPDTRLDIAEAEQMLYRIVAEDSPATTVAPADAAADGETQAVVASAARQEAESDPPPDHPVRPAPLPAGGPAPSGRSRRFPAGLAALAAVAAIAVIAAGIALVLARPSSRAAAAPRASATAPRASATAPRASVTPTGTASTPASAGKAPSPTTTPTPSAATPGNSGSSVLPAGYYRFTNSTGFSIGVPQGWQITHVGHYVYITDPANSGIFLLIDQSDQPKANPLADWQQQAANRQATYPGYHLILLRSVRYTQAEKAADWEFTYNRNGVLVQVLNRNILANARHAYALYWSTPVSDWNAYYHYFQAFAATFIPAPAT